MRFYVQIMCSYINVEIILTYGEMGNIYIQDYLENIF